MGKNSVGKIDGDKLFYSLPIGVVYYNSEGVIEIINPAAEEIFGFASEEIKGKTFAETLKQLMAEDGSDLHPDNLPSRVALNQGTVAKDKIIGFYQSVKKAYRWINVNAVPEFADGQIKPVRIYSTVQDITDDVLARNKLVQKEHDYRALVDNMHSGMVIVQDGCIKFANQELVNKSGYTSEELINSPFLNYIDPAEKKRVADYYVKRLAGIDVPENYRTKVVGRNGLSAWFDVRVKILDYGGKTTTLVLMNDVDAQVEFEKELQASELRFRRLFEEALTGIALVEPEGLLSEVNDRLCEITGYSKHELKGMSFADFTHPDDLDNDLLLFQETVEGKRNGYEILKRYIRKDGVIVWGELKVGLIHDREGNKFILGMVEDRSEQVNIMEELKTARDKANESSRIKSAFLASVSHELRTPLNAVIGFSEIIQSASADKNIKEYSGFIYEAGLKVMTIIDDILDLSMAEHGKIGLRPAEFRVGALFNEFRHQLYEIVYGSGKEDVVSIQCDIADSLKDEIIVTDKSKIFQVIVNLAKNAVKFTDQGFVKMGCFRPHENNISFYVQDSGVGIPEDQQKVIFDFFRQSEGQDHAKYGGIGIGLAISKKIAEAMHGDISVYSEPGNGATFTVTVPFDLRDVTDKIQVKQDELD